MNAEYFLSKKKIEATENKNFQKWFSDSKLADENNLPVIAFHATTQNLFNEVDINKTKIDGWVGQGFYTSNSINDINDNYASSDLDKSRDLRNKIYYNKEEISDLIDRKESSDILNYEELENALDENEMLSIEDAVYLGRKLSLTKNDFKNNITGLIDISDFIDVLSLKKDIQNDGIVMPVYVKMINPVYYTIDETATQIKPINEDLKYFILDNKSDYEKFLDLLKEVSCYLKENDCDNSDIYDLRNAVAMYTGVYNDDCSDDAVQALIDHAMEYCPVEKEDDIEKYIKDCFVDFGFGDYCENTEEWRFDGVIVLNLYESEYENENEEALLYEKIKNETLLKVEKYDYKSLSNFFENFEKENSNIEKNNTVFELLLKIKGDENIEYSCEKAFNETISKIFDGIVLDANYANKYWNFKNIKDGDLHYIVFNPENVKSALGNNGKYSIYDLDMAAKRSYEQKQKTSTRKLRSVIKAFNIFKEEYRDIVNIEKKHADFFTENEDARYDRQTNTVFINSCSLDSVEKLNKIITHEIIGHKGLDLLFGKQKDNILTYIDYHYKPHQYSNIRHLYPELDYNNFSQRLKMTEELICNYAENNYKHHNFLNRIVNTVKNLFIRLKQKLHLPHSPEEDIFTLLHASKKNIDKEINKSKEDVVEKGTSKRRFSH